MNNKKDFFTGAGFDEVNGNNQPMNNGAFDNNQGMMNQQPMQQMPNNSFGGMQSQPMMDNNQMMNQQPMNNGMMSNNQGMMNQQPMQQMPNNAFGGMQSQPMMDNTQMMNQQPMNNGMMNSNQGMMGNQGMMMQQPNPSFGNGFPLKGKFNSNNGIIKVIGTVVILAIIVILVFVFGHKTLSCTSEGDYGVFSAEMTAEIEYWFGKATSRTAIMKMDLEDLDDDQKEQIIEAIEDLAEQSEEEDNVKTSIKKNDKSITLTAKKKITDDDEVDSYDKEKKDFKDVDYVCK